MAPPRSVLTFIRFLVFSTASTRTMAPPRAVPTFIRFPVFSTASTRVMDERTAGSAPAWERVCDGSVVSIQGRGSVLFTSKSGDPSSPYFLERPRFSFAHYCRGGGAFTCRLRALKLSRVTLESEFANAIADELLVLEDLRHKECDYSFVRIASTSLAIDNCAISDFFVDVLVLAAPHLASLRVHGNNPPPIDSEGLSSSLELMIVERLRYQQGHRRARGLCVVAPTPILTTWRTRAQQRIWGVFVSDSGTDSGGKNRTSLPTATILGGFSSNPIFSRARVTT